MLYLFLKLFLLFIFFSIFGYICEVLFVYLTDKELVNRGFLHGPYIPIYGVGSVLTIILLQKYYNDPIIVFFMGMIICASLEYFTSYIMEKIFNRRWWDYSKIKYNLNGRISLLNTFLFGFGCLGIIYLLYPFFNDIIEHFSPVTKIVISSVLLIVFITDLVISILEAVIVSQNVNSLAELLQNINNKKDEKILKIKIRLLEAYPYLAENKELVKKLRKYKKELKQTMKNSKTKNL